MRRGGYFAGPALMNACQGLLRGLYEPKQAVRERQRKMRKPVKRNPIASALSLAQYKPRKVKPRKGRGSYSTKAEGKPSP